MDKNKLEEIKEIHAKANEAYNRFESSSACADQDIITDSLNTLFYEEYTDWLIGYAEESLKIESELRAKIDQQQQEIERLNEALFAGESTHFQCAPCQPGESQEKLIKRYEEALKRIASDETVTFEQTEVIALRALGEIGNLR